MSPNATGTRFYNPNMVDEGGDGQSRFLMNLQNNRNKAIANNFMKASPLNKTQYTSRQGTSSGSNV